MTRSTAIRWGLIMALLLISWGLRLVRLEEVPPGWRDDELINIHALSNQLLSGRFPLYYAGASGHEPLYHHLHAGVHALFGFNVLSGHILSVVFGTLSVALTYSLVRRLFPSVRLTAVVACLMLATSFWSLMYSRTAIRHISLPPFVLATIYAFWRQIESEKSTLRGWGLTGLLLGMTLYTYTASRLLPVLVLVFGGYLALFHLGRFRRHWVGYALALGLMVLLVAPLGIVIVQNRSEEAREGIGADARVTQLARPVRALREGDPGPIISSTVKTLGMFHASGDPEWLYNISGRPVFNLLGGVLLWSGVALCLYRWRNPRYFFLIPWLALGLSPAFISTPPASLSHTILAQPVAYILPALALTEVTRWLRSRGASVAVCTLVLVAVLAGIGIRDLRDYFLVWPKRGMVRFLYRADQREAATFLDEHLEIDDLAIGSALGGPWDRIALAVDVEREDVAFRLFNPERALLWPTTGEISTVLVPSWPEPTGPISDMLGTGSEISPHLTLYSPSDVPLSPSWISETTFANGLALTGVHSWARGSLEPGTEGVVLTAWRVAAPLDLPPMPVVAHPPPPKTYTGPRLAVLAHLLDASGAILAVDDGLWVDPLTLQPGDRFIQVHRFTVPAEGPEGPYDLKLGLYDPKTNKRWAVNGPVPRDYLLISGWSQQ